MPHNWYLIFGVVLLESFGLSLALTWGMRRFALRLGITDKPGERKVHQNPVPLLGGVAIYLSFNIVLIGNLAMVMQAEQFGFSWIEEHVLAFFGENNVLPLIGIFVGGFLIFLLGVVDDVKALSPEMKLLGQLAASIFLVLSGVRLDLFLDPLLRELPYLNDLSPAAMERVTDIVSSVVTIAWIIFITNSLNLLDNMDGLAAGISAIAAMSFFLTVLPQEEYFVCVLLMAFTGAVCGFLYFNLHPARIFMGDAGAMFCGYLLATISVVATFYTESSPSRVVIMAPLLALSIPLFDTFSVMWIRWRRGESIMKGDKRHFSHRLVALGMSQSQAVEFIYLVGAIIGLGGALLGSVQVLGTVVILVQTTGVFLLIAVLMQAARGGGRER